MSFSQRLILLFVVLSFGACTKPHHSNEASALSNEIVNEGIVNVPHALERVDSAEQAGVFTVVQANIVKRPFVKMPICAAWRPITQRKPLLQRWDMLLLRQPTAAFIAQLA